MTKGELTQLLQGVPDYTELAVFYPDSSIPGTLLFEESKPEQGVVELKITTLSPAQHEYYLYKAQEAALFPGMTPEEIKYLKETYVPCHAARRGADGEVFIVVQFMFTYAILSELNQYGYGDRWCYETKDAALRAFYEWDGAGEPNYWHRHPTTGRRRPNGDKAQEYVAH
jgi:hypothetical protein